LNFNRLELGSVSGDNVVAFCEGFLNQSLAPEGDEASRRPDLLWLCDGMIMLEGFSALPYQLSFLYTNKRDYHRLKVCR
jgi:hypothetical protein